MVRRFERIEPDGRGYELVSSVRALVPQKFSVEEELMHVKHVDVKSPHVGVMWKFGRELSAQATAVNEKPPVSEEHRDRKAIKSSPAKPIGTSCGVNRGKH
ncbi:hypothetical protein TNCV_5083581 [Trichonephila clavipes]|nr:hypothetical protein TNCV_5083581 [Trichonephila clavipes]